MRSSTKKLHKRVREFYSSDSIVKSYDEKRFLSPQGALVNDIELGKIASLCQPEAGHRILDIGVGRGRVAKKYSLTNYVVGLDQSFAMLESLNKETKSVRCIQADCTQLPFNNHVFDGVISLRVMLHFNTETLTQTLKEVKRVLKKEGVFIFDVYSIFSLSYLLPYKRRWLNVYHNIQKIDTFLRQEWSGVEKMYAFSLPRAFYLHSPTWLLNYIHWLDKLLGTVFRGKIASSVYYKLTK